MAIIKCKICGGDLMLQPNSSTAECEYCGTIQTVPSADNEKKLTLFARANRLRMACEFDKASGVYEAIVADFPEEAEAYWGLVLCKYGIEYVDDPASGQKVPTCHRSGFDSVMDDDNFEQALENADVLARKVYRDEAKQIEKIRKGIIEVSSKEDPYDIFICYKETDIHGNRTLDSVLAQDIYTALTEKGYRVFFSRITLEDKLGQEYEPYIFAALNSAKIMLAVGTDYEHYNAVWVKNEWSRFLHLISSGQKKTLIPCYKNLDAYDMPKEFAKLQAQDLGKVGAMQDLLRGIEKILPKTNVQQVIQESTGVQGGFSSDTGRPGVLSLLKRAFMFLEDCNWKDADSYCDKVLDIDPENAQAYFGKLLADLHVSKEENLKNCKESIENNSNYKYVVRFGSDSMKSTLQGYVAEQKRILNEEACRLALRRTEIAQGSYMLSAGESHTVGLYPNGTVVAVGDYKYGRCNVDDWNDIVAVSVSAFHSVGLHSNGTVIAVGDNCAGQCNVTNWAGIEAISAGTRHTVGLRRNGTVVATGYYDRRCDVSGWTDIVAVSAGGDHTVGLRHNGTVVAVGDNSKGQCNVHNWTDIVAISAGDAHTVGLHSNGTVVAVGDNGNEQCNVGDWTDIVAVSAGYYHTVGLCSDGTVIAIGNNKDGQCDVSSWTDIIAVSVGTRHTAALRSDGTVVAVGTNDGGRRNVSNWKLFRDYRTIEAERKDAAEERVRQEQIRQEEAARRREDERIKYVRRNQGHCQHCGGEFKGFFSKTCVSCGKPKDY